MRKQSVKVTTLVIILSILAVSFQFFCYYFFDNGWLVLTLTLVTSILVAHFFLEASLSYVPGFLQSLIMVGFSFIFTILIAKHWAGSLFVYRSYLPYMVLLNWLVPCAYFIVRSLYDRGPRFEGFQSFFVKTSILFGALYVFILAVKLFIYPMEAPYALIKSNTDPNFIPLWTTAGQIEDFIYQETSLTPTILYFFESILLFIPYGFYLRLIMRPVPFILRAAIMTVFPLSIEFFQYIFKTGHCDVDDFIFAILGTLTGVLFYQILNRIFLAKTEYAFLEERPSYSFYQNLYY